VRTVPMDEMKLEYLMMTPLVGSVVSNVQGTASLDGFLLSAVSGGCYDQVLARHRGRAKQGDPLTYTYNIK
jgi:hypothetical protein